MPGASDFSYQHVQRRVWTDGKFRALSAPPPNAQTLWLFLITGEYTTKIPGVIANAGRAGMAEFLEWPLEDFERCFEEIAAQSMAIADWRNRLIYLPSAFRQPDNHPRSTSTVVAWRKVLNNLPECYLRDHVEHDLRELLTSMGPEFSASFEHARRTDLFSKRDDTKRLVSTIPTAPPARSPDPDPFPIPSPDPEETHDDSAIASSSSVGTQEGFKLDPPPSAPVLDFEACYRLYPRKEGKKEGMRLAKSKIRTTGAIQLFEAAIRNYATLVVNDDYKRIKHFSTFVGCWEDYAPGNWQAPPPATATSSRDLGRGQVPVARDLDYSTGGQKT